MAQNEILITLNHSTFKIKRHKDSIRIVITHEDCGVSQKSLQFKKFCIVISSVIYISLYVFIYYLIYELCKEVGWVERKSRYQIALIPAKTLLSSHNFSGNLWVSWVKYLF